MVSIKIVITSSFGTLSRGRHSARLGLGSDVTWAGKDARGNLVIDKAGVWQLHCTDGFRRTARAILEVDEDGGWEMSGDTRRFDVIEDDTPENGAPEDSPTAS